MNRLIPILLGFSLMSLVSTAPLFPAQAADAAPASQPSQPSAPPQEGATPSPPDRTLSGSEQRRAEDKGDVFRPSEDISEDLAVTFPVDI